MSIHDRLLLLLRAEGGRLDVADQQARAKGDRLVTRGFWLNLESRTGIKVTTWRYFASGKQKSTPEMIEAAARHWPQYAFWLTTGITDAANGHVAPESVFTFPEVGMIEDEHSNAYFAKSIELLIRQQKAAAEEFANAESAGVRVYSHPGAGGLSVVDSSAYEALLGIWNRREEVRPSFPSRVSRVKSHEHTPTHEDLFYGLKPKG